MGWTGVAVYSGAYQTGVDGRILEDDHTSGGCRMVLDYLGNRTSDSEKDKKIGAALAMYPFLERKWGIPLVILAVLISLSRLYVGVHYPTDVLGGAVVGVLAAWGAVRIVKRREIKGNREG